MTLLCIDTSSAHAILALAEERTLLAEKVIDAPRGVAERIFGDLDALLARGRLAQSRLAQSHLGLEALTTIGVAVGPGGFTAVRVGLAMAKGLALAGDVDIVGVSSLRVLARGFAAGTVADAHSEPSEPSEPWWIPMTRAYRGEVFAAVYQRHGAAQNKHGLQEMLAPFHGSPEAVVQHVLGVIQRGGQDAGTAQHLVFGGSGYRGHAVAVNHAMKMRAVGDITWIGVASERDAPSAQALVDEVIDALEERGPDDLVTLEPHYVHASDAQLPAKPLQLDH